MVKKAGPDECWEWIGRKTKNGYGRLNIGPHPHRAHRLAFLIANGRIDPELLVLHSCDRKLCVNPKHLSQGTTQQNSHEAVKRGLYRRGVTNGRSKLTEYQIRQIRNSDHKVVSNVELAKRYRVTATIIGFVKRRKSWKHIL